MKEAMNTQQIAAEYQKKRRKRRRWRKTAACLAAAAVLGTGYALMHPAIAMSQETFCGKQAHEHDESCFAWELVCRQEEAPDDVQDDVQDAEEGHVHTDACYAEELQLVCGEEAQEDSVHEHGPDCYDEEDVLICDEPEWTEEHMHTEDCYEAVSVLICGEEESEAPPEDAPEAHVHTQSCYESVRICPLEEHVHDDGCYVDQTADVESAAQWEATIPALSGRRLGESVAIVAKSQVGYTQSEYNYVIDDAGRVHGYTRYGAWYGYPYGEWCAMFASFCLHYAGVSDSRVPYASGCAYWVEILREEGLLEYAGSYTPKTGDLVFFDTDADGVSDHVGVVTDCSGGKIETVEGNIGGAVVERSYRLEDEEIFAFGVLPEEEELPEEPGEDAQEESPEEDPAEEEPEDEDPSEPEDEDQETDEQMPEPDEEVTWQTPEELLQALERLESLDALDEEDAQIAQELLSDLEQAFAREELSEEDYADFCARVTALLEEVYAAIAEPCEGTNWISLQESGWFEAYSDAAYGLEESPQMLFSAEDFPETYDAPAPSDVQIEDEGGTRRSADGVFVSKTIAGTELENVFDITLQVQTPMTASQIIQEPDMAVVIVMDISNTMNSDFPAGSKTTRYSAAMDAADQFLDQFAASSTLGVSKIAYVAFNSDAQQIFGLQSCSSQAQANALKDIMREQTGNIINAEGYGISARRFTNIEAGLKLAEDILDRADNRNKFIIFLSDGFPTTYIESGYRGYDTYDKDGAHFYDHVLERKCLYGVSYSDTAAVRARQMAEEIKASGTKIFSIGVDVEGQTIQKYITQSEKADGFSVVDRKNTRYEIGRANDTQAYKNWLGNSIGSGYYYDSTDAAGLEAAYEKIFEQIKKTIEAGSKADWVASDPMPSLEGVQAVEFIGMYDQNREGYRSELTGENEPDAENTASFQSGQNAIHWDLKQSGYQKSQSGGTTLCLYTLRYRVRLQNETDGFLEEEIYQTNGPTTLRYRAVETVDGSLQVSEPKTIDFPIPSVKGYLCELVFQKQDNYGNALAGAEFTLSHSGYCTVCRGDGTQTELADLTARSEEDGTVTFSKIPSGHTYLLIETKTPPGCSANANHYEVTASYDVLTVNVTDYAQKAEVPWDGVIVNNIYYALPETGGTGTLPYTAGGLLLLWMAGTVYARGRRRRRGDFIPF